MCCLRPCQLTAVTTQAPSFENLRVPTCDLWPMSGLQLCLLFPQPLQHLWLFGQQGQHASQGHSSCLMPCTM